jgi:hypothetical protein
MLEVKPNCENCGKLLPYNSTEAMICSFECTFCAECVVNILENVCPNCGGGFEKRPIRPMRFLEKYPVSQETFVQAIEREKFIDFLKKYKDINPQNR